MALTAGITLWALAASTAVAAPDHLAFEGDATPSPTPSPGPADSATIPDGLTSATPGGAQAAAAATNRPVEVLAGRTSFEQVFAEPDGTWSAVLSTSPMFVQVAGDGTWEADWAPLDTTLEVDPDGMIRPVAFPETFELSPGGASVDTLLTMQVRGSDAVIELMWDGSALPAPTLDGPRATYVDVYPSVDYVVELLPSGMEQYFVVTGPEGLSTTSPLALDVRTSAGHEILESSEDGGVVIVDAAGDEVAFMPTPRAWDAAGDALRAHPVLEDWSLPASEVSIFDGPDARVPNLPQSITAKASRGASVANDHHFSLDVVGEGRRASVRLDVDPAWAAASERQFPLVIDPTLKSSSWHDGYVTTESPNSSYSSGSELFVGTYNGGSAVRRSYVNFDVSSVKALGPIELSSARFYIYNHHSWSCSSSKWYVYETNALSSSVTWNSQPTGSAVTYIASSSETRGYSSSCGDGYVSADVSGMFQDWLDGLDNTRAVFLVAKDEWSSSYSWKRFWSRDSSSSSRHPKINYYYNSYPDTPTALAVQGVDVMSTAGSPTALASASPQIVATVSDSDGGNVRAALEVYQDGVLVVSGVWSDFEDQGSGSSATVTFDLPIELQYGFTYTFAVRSDDGSIASEEALVGVHEFTLDPPEYTDTIPDDCDDQASAMTCGGTP